MTHARFYPQANHDVQWYGEGNYTMPMTHVKNLLHSTETPSWPGYDGGAKAPTLTYKPSTRQWRQHFPINGSARALKDPSGTTVRENRADVVQTEICAYSEPGVKPNILDLTDDNIRDLAQFYAWLHKEWGAKLEKAPRWKSYPNSYGLSNGVRMSSSEFTTFEGMCGHQHASGNLHGDPSYGPWIDKLLAMTKTLAGASTTANITIATAAIVHAWNGERFGPQDTYLADARQFLAWASHPKVGAITDWREDQWNLHYNDYPINKELFQDAVHGVQRHFGQRVRDLDTETLLPMQRFGYTLISYEGKVIPKED